MSYNYENDDFEIDDFSDSDDLKTKDDGDYKWTDDLFEKIEVEEYDADAIIENKTKDLDAVDNDFIDEHTIDTGSIEFFQKERINETTGKKVKNYVNNDTFCSEVIRWNTLRKEAEANGTSVPPMPDCIGKQIMLMADGLSKRYNFRNYTYIDEMREDGIYMAIRAVRNYDPTKSNNNNAFGYFNRVIWQAFSSKITAEAKEHKKKLDLLKDPLYLGYSNSETNNDKEIDKDKIISFYDN